MSYLEEIYEREISHIPFLVVIHLLLFAYVYLKYGINYIRIILIAT